VPQPDPPDLVKVREAVHQLSKGKSVPEIFLDPNVGLSLEIIQEIANIVQNENPLVKLDDGGRPAILSYNVPNSASYRGLFYLTVRHPSLDASSQYDWFKSELKQPK
jgi:hypothetical protein